MKAIMRAKAMSTVGDVDLVDGKGLHLTFTLVWDFLMRDALSLLPSMFARSSKMSSDL